MISSGDTLPLIEEIVGRRRLTIDAIVYGPADGGHPEQWHTIVSPEPVEAARGQTYWAGPYFPKEKIDAMRNGYLIEKLSHFDVEGRGVWVEITGRRESYRGGQVAVDSPDFPEHTIEEYWDRGFCINSMTHNGQRWGLVMTRVECRQRWWSNLEAEEMVDKMKKFWDKNYVVTSLSWAGKKKWILVMTYGRNDYPEAVHWEEFLPETLIQGRIREGYRVSHIGYNRYWVVVMTQVPRGMKGMP